MRIDQVHPSKVSLSYTMAKALIMDHKIYPGEHIQIVDLAKRFKCSVTPIREALAQLHFESLVTFKANRGYYAREVDLTEQIELHEASDVILNHVVLHCSPQFQFDQEIDLDAQAYREFLENIVAASKNRQVRMLFSNALDRSFGLIDRYLRDRRNREQLKSDLIAVLDIKEPRRMSRILLQARRRFAEDLPDLVRDVVNGRRATSFAYDHLGFGTHTAADRAWA